MATTPSSISGSARGIARTLDGFVIQSESIKESPISEQVPDQNGAIADEIVYDHRYDLTLSVISASSTRTAPAHSNDTLAYDSKNWRVDSCEEAGTYNGVVKWNISAHRYDNFPAAPAAQAAQ